MRRVQRYSRAGAGRPQWRGHLPPSGARRAWAFACLRAASDLQPLARMARVDALVLFLVAAGCTGAIHTGEPVGADAAPGCVPACGTATCGDDGCGGPCGTCDGDELCTAGTCSAITGVQFQVDVSSAPHPIHPEIYGLAFADATTIHDLGITVNRWGGNGVTLYNWQLDTGNTASDWYYENIANNAGDPSYGTPAYRSAADRFFEANHAAGADTLLVLPTIGWTAKDRPAGHPFTCGFPVSKYGAQQLVDPYDPNCGNGKDPAGQPLTSDPSNDATAAPPSFERLWLDHLVGRYGAASAGGVRYYSLDNEMMLWDSTHRDAHPAPVSYDEVWKATTDYAPVVRAADPGAYLLGYGSWGVLDLFQSGLDSSTSYADRHAHGDQPLAAWYLTQLAAYEQQHGQRLVDCLDVHYYPQGGDSLQNTASLWDASYHDPSWVNDWLGEPVRLLPRLAEWIAASYPGTGICISEYNFNLNDPDHPDAALAEADVLGLFGKYGVRLATYWTTPVGDGGVKHGAYFGLAMLRNFDGAGGRFGDVSVGAASTIPGVAVYAATSTSQLTVLLINKTAQAQAGHLGIVGFAPGAAAKTYTFAAGAAAIVHGADLAVTDGKLAVSLPARSMAMLVVPGP